MTDKEKLNAIRAEVEEYIDAARKAHTNITEGNFAHLLSFIDSLQEDPVSKDLEEAAVFYANTHTEWFDHEGNPHVAPAFKEGAQWKKEHLWKPADGDDLPEIDREVIVLYKPYPWEGNEYVVGFAHRPKEYWDGRNIETDEVTRYYPKRYDKGDWNVPDVKFWLDLELPTQKGSEL